MARNDLGKTSFDQGDGFAPDWPLTSSLTLGRTLAPTRFDREDQRLWPIFTNTSSPRELKIEF